MMMYLGCHVVDVFVLFFVVVVLLLLFFVVVFCCFFGMVEFTTWLCCI